MKEEDREQGRDDVNIYHVIKQVPTYIVWWIILEHNGSINYEDVVPYRSQIYRSINDGKLIIMDTCLA